MKKATPPTGRAACPRRRYHAARRGTEETQAGQAGLAESSDFAIEYKPSAAIEAHPPCRSTMSGPAS
jgi:hypothetical protein